MVLNQNKVQKVLKYRWVIFTVLSIAYFFVYFHRVSVSVVASDMMKTLGVGAAGISMLGSAYFYAYTACQLPSGLLADSWGVKKTATVFIFLAAIGSILTGISTNFYVVLLGRVLIGIGAAMVYIPVMKVLELWFKKQEFATMSGVLLAIGNIGALCAAGPLAIVSAMMGSWQMVFMVLGIFTAILAILIWFTVKDSPKDINCPLIGEIEAEENKEEYTPVSVERMPMVEALKITFTSGRKFWPLALWFFFAYCIMVYQGLWGGPFFEGVLGWSKTISGVVLSMIAVGMIFGCPFAGILSDKILHSRKQVLLIGTGVNIICWFILWIISGTVTSIIVYSVLNFCIGFFTGFYVVSYAQVKEWFPSSMVGTTTGAINLFPFLGGAIFMSLTGGMITAKNGVLALAQFKSVWLLLFVLTIIAFVFLLFSVEKKEEDEIVRE